MGEVDVGLWRVVGVGSMRNVDLTPLKLERDQSYSLVCHAVSDMILAKCVSLSD